MSVIHFTWTEDMSVGEKTLDAQHQKLLAQLNKVIDALSFGPSSKEVDEALHFFEEYVTEHLTYEEDYMQRRGFHDLEVHKAKHQVFRDKYKDFKDKLASGKLSTNDLIHIEQFLGRWWIEHISYEDQRYHQTLGANPHSVS